MKKRYLFILAAALCLGLVLGLHLLLSQTAQTVSWGLSYPVPGRSPQGPATEDQLEKLGACYLGDTREKVLYLTFDAGYENGCTARILDTLKKHDAPAAFFLVGNYLSKNPDLVRRMVAEGHTVGNHTMHHRDTGVALERATFVQELTELEALFTEITGQSLSKYYRPPQGKYTSENLEQARQLGYRTVLWSLAYADWDNAAQPTRAQAFDKLLSRVHPGAIVLLHSTSQTNAEILDELLTKWEEMGYRFASLDELPAL